MKKLLIGIVSLGIILNFSCGNGGNPPESSTVVDTLAIHENCNTLTDSERVRLSYEILSDSNNKYSFDSSDLRQGVKNFYKYFKHFDRQSNQISDFEKDTAILSLIHLSLLTQKCKEIDNYASNNGVAALRLHYAIENKKMVLLFEPIYLTKGEEDRFYIVKNAIIRMWKIENDDLNEVPNPNMLLNAYQSRDSSISRIKIKHLNPAEVSDNYFIKDSNNAYRGDIKSCILPIQQLEKMLCDNNEHNSETRINFSIVANNNFDFGGPTPSLYNYKLHVVAYLNSIALNDTLDSYLHLGADFGQMDPPGRIYVKYPSSNQKKNEK